MTTTTDSIELTKVAWQKLVDAGQRYVKEKDKVNWALADLFLTVRDEPAFGSSRLENYALDIDYGLSSAYNYASVANFYRDPAIRAEIDGMKTMKFYKAQAVIGYVHNEDYTHDEQVDEAMEWLRKCNDGPWSVDKLRYELKQHYGKKGATTTTICKGQYKRSQLRTIVDQLPVGKTYQVTIKEVD